MKLRMNIAALALLWLLSPMISFAQPAIIQDYSSSMEIPAVKAMAASESHLYVLSDEEGLAVFRIYPDQLLWLYTSAGMQRRGDQIRTDARFAYLFGESNRLTVLEPTNVLGVYSATTLPERPLGAARLQNVLYIALGPRGLGALYLTSPESVDSTVVYPVNEEFNGVDIIDVAVSQTTQQLFALGGDSYVYVFSSVDNKLELVNKVLLTDTISRIFSTGEELIGTSREGNVYPIRSKSLGVPFGNVFETVNHLAVYKGDFIIRTIGGRLWIIDKDSERPIEYKMDILAENFVASNGEQAWVSENNNISKVIEADSTQTSETGSEGIGLLQIENKTLTYPNPLIQPIFVSSNQPISEIELSVRSDVDNADIKGQSLFWQPTPDQLGLHSFTIVASRSDGLIDSTRFEVDLKSFNSPPRFSPVRNTSIGVEELYELSFIAVDPENQGNSLIRYIGVDLPDGSNLNERTGAFSWTPTRQQIGKNTFRIIATDQLGAASSIDVSIEVLDLNREN